MEQSSKPRALASRPWLLLLCLAQAAIVGVTRAELNTDAASGFITIDCGFLGTSYVDTTTTLSFIPDVGFTDAGENHNISAAYATPQLPSYFRNVRSFPTGTRNCYTFPSLTPGNKYLLRASFMYGNYDGKNRLPDFDLYVGVHYWTNVSVPDNAKLLRLAVFVVVPDDFVEVCLINTGRGTPFISVLSLRPVKTTLYPQVTATQGLVLQARYSFDQQPTDDYKVVRYPADPLDRIWFSFISPDWDLISTKRTVRQIESDPFDSPTKVMQTAVTPRAGSVSSKSIKFPWNTTAQPTDPSPGYFVVMYFAELNSSDTRELSISIGDLWTQQGILQPQPLVAITSFNNEPIGGNSTRLDVFVNATADSTLPPFINAIEVFSAISTPNTTGTNSQDVSAMKAIKDKYRVLTKNWMGDPCVDKAWKWDGLTCSYPTSGSPTVTGVNMSFSGLNGEISSTFANLQSVQFLDLSHNNLTGSIPDALSQLSSLTFLNLTGNQLSGSIPRGLLEKIRDGSLNLIHADNPNLCTASDICQLANEKSKLAIYIAVPMALLALAMVVGLLLCFLRLKRRGSMNNPAMPGNETLKGHAPTGDDHGRRTSLRLQNRRFTYKDLKRVTNNFQRVIGRGGFGYVYEGFLEDGTQVAVKVRSQSSNQGVKEFLTEAQILTRVHHKNLVSMIGYCKDGGYMALVYEYMSQGTLHDHITGRHLTWRLRLRIALESAVGLEYLHKGCNPPIIHRDVKTTNILLNAKLEAKVADFGLSKDFINRGISTHVSTNTVVGTPGYVDPEYYATMQPTTKSDVYSFGVVLLQLVTGKQPIFHNPHSISVIQWTQKHLAQGDIEGVLDACMRGNHDVNSVWKATEVALQCTAHASAQRPTMTDVVAQLQECLGLEESRAGSEATESFYYNGGSDGPSMGYNAHVLADRSADELSLNNTFEIVHNFGMDAGPATR